MLRLRILTTTVLAAAAAVVAPPAAHALTDAQCDYSITGLPASGNAVFVATGRAVVTSTEVRALHLACDYYLPNDEVHTVQSSPGPVAVIAGTQLVELGAVITCTTLTVDWSDGSTTTDSHCYPVPG